MKTKIVVLCALIIGGCDFFDSKSKIPMTFEGWGPIRIGMTYEEFKPYISDDTVEATGGRCEHYFKFDDIPQAMTVNLMDKKISTIQITGVANVSTDRGINLDSTLDDVRQIYSEYSMTEFPATPAHGAKVIVWNSLSEPHKDYGRQAIGISFQAWRSNAKIRFIKLGLLYPGGEGC